MLPVQLLHIGGGLGRQFHPGGAEAAFDGVPDGLDVGPCGAVEGDLPPGQDLQGQPAGQRGGNPPPPVGRQNVHADLPHAPAVGGTGGEARQRFPVIGPQPQHVQLPALLAQGVAPLRAVQGPKVLRPQDPDREGAVQGPQPVQIRQKIFRHEAHPQPLFLQRVIQNMQVRRLEAVLRREAAEVGGHELPALLRHGGHHVVPVGDQVAVEGQLQIPPGPGIGP